MKKINNNQGMTIIEILVSITLISMVVIFLMLLISDVKSDSNLAKDKLTANYNRTIIIKTIQDDLKQYEVKQIKLIHGAGNSNQIHFTFGDGHTTIMKKLTVNEDSIEYKNEGNNKSEKWLLSLKDAKYDGNNLLLCKYTIAYEGTNSGTFVKIIIPTDLSNTIYKDTSLDLDIELSYYTSQIDVVDGESLDGCN